MSKESIKSIEDLQETTTKQEAHGTQRSPEKTVQIGQDIWLSQCWLREEKTHYLLYENWMVLNLKNLNPLYPRMHCGRFGWNWPSGSGKEDFINFQNVYLLFCYLLKEKGVSLRLNKQTWIPFTKGCFVPSLVEICPVEEDFFKFCQCIFAIS